MRNFVKPLFWGLTKSNKCAILCVVTPWARTLPEGGPCGSPPQERGHAFVGASGGENGERGATPPAHDHKNENERGNIMNEVVQLITTLISNVGFPIACVCYLFYSQQKEREAHAIESKAWVDALDRNTQVMERLEGKLSTIKEG